MAIEPTQLHTARLLLRPFRLEDAEDVFAYSSDEAFCYFLIPGPAPTTRAEVENDLAAVIRTPWHDYPCFGRLWLLRLWPRQSLRPCRSAQCRLGAGAGEAQHAAGGPAPE